MCRNVHVSVVSKMEEAAKAQGKSDYKIWAVEQGEIEAELGNFDVLLLGPQVRHIMRKVNRSWTAKRRWL